MTEFSARAQGINSLHREDYQVGGGGGHTRAGRSGAQLPSLWLCPCVWDLRARVATQTSF